LIYVKIPAANISHLGPFKNLAQRLEGEEGITEVDQRDSSEEVRRQGAGNGQGSRGGGSHLSQRG
jgi:hypothetical protein